MDGDGGEGGGLWPVSFASVLLSLLELAQDIFTLDSDVAKKKIDPRPRVPNQSGEYAGLFLWSLC